MPVQAQSKTTLFTKCNLTASHFVYNDAKSVLGTTGWISARAEDLTVQFQVATKIPAAGTKIVYRVEGRFDANSKPASIYVKQVSVKQNISEIYIVDEKVSEIRIGAKTSATIASPLGSPCIFYAAALHTEYH